MRILTLNYGSTNLKWAVFENDVRCEAGRREATDDAQLQAAVQEILWSRLGRSGPNAVDTPSTRTAASAAYSPKAFPADELPATPRRGSPRPPAAVVHRVVHGGRLERPALIDTAVLQEITRATAFSPIHNRRALIGIQAAERFGVPQIAVFDTAFHATLPDVAQTYALPRELRDRGIRRFGFHGLAFASALGQLADTLGRPAEGVDAILVHLGGGCSVCAVKGGRSIDTSMGLTPLEGLVMGTRSGDVDPGIVLWLINEGHGAADIEELLVRKAGLIGLAGTQDMRAIEQRAAAGDGDAELALEVYCYRIRKYIGAYLAVLGRADAIVFSGGVGEHSATVRQRVLEPLASLGIVFDERRNGRGEQVISPPGRTPVVLVASVDEETEMVRQARQVLRESDRGPEPPA